jgi:hypothetical protein
MKEPDDLASVGICSSDVRTLVPIAVKTSQGQIFENGPSSVLPRNDMIGVKRQRIYGSRKLAVLAPVLRALPHLPGEVPDHEWGRLWGFLLRASRALDCMTARRFPICR